MQPILRVGKAMDPAVKLPGTAQEHERAPYGASDSIEMAAKRLCFVRRDGPASAELGLADVAASGVESSPVRLEARDLAQALSPPAPGTSALATPPVCHSLDDLGPDLLLHILRKAHPTGTGGTHTVALTTNMCLSTCVPPL